MEFKNKLTMKRNSARRGGGIYNAGEIEVMKKAVFKANSATVRQIVLGLLWA